MLFDEKYAEKDEVILDICDIDNNSLEVFKAILKKYGKPTNFIVNFKNVDFLLWNCRLKYDVVVGNPPYKKLTKSKELLAQYKLSARNRDTNNLFSFFIEKSLRLGDYVSLIVPKSLLSKPTYKSV